MIDEAPMVADTRICTTPALPCGVNHGSEATLKMYGTAEETCVVLLSFQPSPDALNAVLANEATLELELHRVPAHDECGNQPSTPCPAAAGDLLVQALRTDWNEGEADWCVKMGPEMWGDAGAMYPDQDIFGVVGTSNIDTAAQSVTIELTNLTAFDEFVLNGRLAVRLHAVGGAAFVAASKEHGALAAPVLRIRTCN
jgi:hypothetical protein